MTTKTTSDLDFSVSLFQGDPCIRMPQRLTVLEALTFKQLGLHLLDGDPCSHQLYLDFSQTKFIDSSGVGALVHLFKSAKEKSVEMVLLDATPSVMAVLRMTGLHEFFAHKTTRSDTVKQQSSQLDLLSNLSTSDSLPETHPSVRSWVKRGLDIAGGLLGICITALLFLPIAIAIRLDSKGPIWFSQVRCGWMGKRFKMVKFRSMCVDAEQLKSTIPNEAQGAFFKNANDPRVTSVGRFLRRTSLDELPQFWNVLKGDMSLVGTRPPTPDEVELYEVPSWQRLDVRPGMTGEWQVNGRSQITNFEDVIKLDLLYQENWSHFHDLKLILKTVFILFRKDNGAA